MNPNMRSDQAELKAAACSAPDLPHKEVGASGGCMILDPWRMEVIGGQQGQTAHQAPDDS